MTAAQMVDVIFDIEQMFKGYTEFLRDFLRSDGRIELMTNVEKAYTAYQWLESNLPEGAAILQEIHVDGGNVVRRHVEVTADVRDQIRCLCEEFARLEKESRPAQDGSKASKEKTQGDPVAAQERPSRKLPKPAPATKTVKRK